MTKTLVCFHGWGGSKESFTELKEALKHDDVTVLAPDLPGFGDEPDPEHPFSNDDYADWALCWLSQQMNNGKLTMKNEWFLLGHSHGGRVAIKLVTEKLSILHSKFSIPSHLFLCAAAGIHHPRHIKRVIGLMLAKGGKAIFALPGLRKLEPLGKTLLYKLVRVHDYEKASEVMRKTLILVTREDLKPLLRHISVPTDLFWGTDDGMTPYSDARIMEKEIPHAKLHAYAGVRHRVHRDRAMEIAAVIRTYL
ncbi:MAG: alpha/beta hydrolase [Candidatus Peregrinibacteria bacterium]|nr:alpha/beta hydrolase [Candidatus Peregrinibacteria bacterium]MCB9808314.1 alpha/beta hydrolase [Candidatus Peribacteria bacterium]